MRLVIGCTLGEQEVEAIARGEKLREVVDRSLSNFPLMPGNIEEADALELLSWMVAQGYLEVKLALYHFTLILIQVGSKGAGGKEQGAGGKN